MTLHKQALGASTVAVVPITGTALGSGVEEQYGCQGRDQQPSLKVKKDGQFLRDTNHAIERYF